MNLDQISVTHCNFIAKAFQIFFFWFIFFLHLASYSFWALNISSVQKVSKPNFLHNVQRRVQGSEVVNVHICFK